jgi:hypothetical protein
MFCKINHNYSYLNCGVLCIFSYQNAENTYEAPYKVDENMFYTYQEKTGRENVGAKLVQGGFCFGEDKSIKMYTEMVALWGEPAFKTEQRKNDNSDSTQFFTAIWDLKDMIDNKGRPIKQKEAAKCAA